MLASRFLSGGGMRCDMLQKTPSYDCATANPRGSARKGAPARAAAPGGKRASLFNYSEEEWSEIEVAIQVVRKGPLPKKARKWLVGEARWYLAARSQLINERRTWQKATLLAERLRQLIWGVAERDRQLMVRAGYSMKKSQATANIFYSEDLGAVARIRDSVEAVARGYERYPTEGAHFDNPKLMYQFKVLLIWTSLGGELRVSRHPKHGKVQGPLARFFRAVTGPVMGALTPSPESLPDIIERQKRFLAFEATPEGRFALKNDFFHRDPHWPG